MIVAVGLAPLTNRNGPPRERHGQRWHADHHYELKYLSASGGSGPRRATLPAHLRRRAISSPSARREPRFERPFAGASARLSPGASPSSRRLPPLPERRGAAISRGPCSRRGGTAGP